MGYANESGHTFPHIVDEIVDLYLAGGVTLKQLGEKYGLSPGRIRQLIAREKKRRGSNGPRLLSRRDKLGTGPA